MKRPGAFKILREKQRPMTRHTHQTLCDRLAAASKEACRRRNMPEVDARRLDDALGNAIDPRKLVDNLAEAWRCSADEARKVLAEAGFAALVARAGVESGIPRADEATGPPLSTKRRFELAGGRICVQTLGPRLDEPVRAPGPVLDSVRAALDGFLPGAAADPLAVLYRSDPLGYARRWLMTEAPRIEAYVGTHFGDRGPSYLVNSGIGANEQFNYFVSALANERPGRGLTWLLANSPKEIARLPADASIENTLFMEFSRSGITEETVKLHELTPPESKRIVFANSGPLRALGERDGNLVLELPSEVSGRYGRNTTPILLAPMLVAGLDVEAYWKEIAAACAAFDLGAPHSPPVVLAQYIRLQQLRRGANHVYLGTNDARLIYSADEFCQFWNEGVNRDGNDLTMSRYLGLPRDSHMNLEAILGTAERKIAVFLLRTCEIPGHGLLLRQSNPVNPDHAGLSAADVDLVLALANARRCSEKMPTILVTVDRIDLAASAWLGQLWADATLAYARLIGVDPGSNPEVKAVRTRASGWLADKSAALAMIENLS